jgi:hypothetical protein
MPHRHLAQYSAGITDSTCFTARSQIGAGELCTLDHHRRQALQIEGPLPKPDGLSRPLIDLSV